MKTYTDQDVARVEVDELVSGLDADATVRLCQERLGQTKALLDARDLAITRRYLQGGVSHTDLAQTYDLSPTTIRDAIKRNRDKVATDRAADRAAG